MELSSVWGAPPEVYSVCDAIHFLDCLLEEVNDHSSIGPLDHEFSDRLVRIQKRFFDRTWEPLRDAIAIIRKVVGPEYPEKVEAKPEPTLPGAKED